MARPSIGRVIAGAALALGLCATAAASSVQNGTFALPDGRALVRAELTVRPNGAAANRLDIAQYAPDSQVPIADYRADQTKLMHLVLVRDDFAGFQHVHPRFAGGHFTVDVTLDAGHRYYAYSDSLPSRYPQQVFRFVLQAGAPPHTVNTSISPGNKRIAAGPYDVALSTVHLRAGRAANVPVRITRNGRIASDVHPYLGAAAHAVFIDTQSLAYVHVHPMTSGSMSGMEDMKLNDSDTLPGEMTLMVPPLKAGLYKLWLQFRGGKGLYAAPFTLAVK